MGILLLLLFMPAKIVSSHWSSYASKSFKCRLWLIAIFFLQSSWMWPDHSCGIQTGQPSSAALACKVSQLAYWACFIFVTLRPSLSQKARTLRSSSLGLTKSYSINIGVVALWDTQRKLGRARTAALLCWGSECSGGQNICEHELQHDKPESWCFGS